MEDHPVVDLHPDLVAHLEPMEKFGQMLRHPLMYAVPYFGPFSHEHLNRLYEFRCAQLSHAMATHDFSLFVFTHERPHRLSALQQVVPYMDEADFNKLLFDVYVDSENISQNLDEWVDLLEPLVGLDAWDSTQDLPDELTIFRGGSKTGISWTLDLEKAKWFAQRMGQLRPVWQTTVFKDEIVGFTNARSESEVILTPSVLRNKTILLHEHPL
jgi:hypothetical protein